MTELEVSQLKINELLRKIARQENILNQMNIRCCAVEFENKRLKKLLYKSLHTGIDAADIEQYDLAPMIAEHAVRELLRPLKTMGFPTRVQFVFIELNIKTLKDLLYEIKYNKMMHIIECRTIGKKLIREILYTLQREGVSDEYNRCYLFPYV